MDYVRVEGTKAGSKALVFLSLRQGVYIFSLLPFIHLLFPSFSLEFDELKLLWVLCTP